jgi:hypothetical protein
VLQLLEDDGRRARLATEAVRVVRSRFGRDRQLEEMDVLYREAYAEITHRRLP